MKVIYELKIAIGIYGEVAFLEKFPETEEHDWANELLDDCRGEFERAEQPGLYVASMGMEQTQSDHTGEYDAYLDILATRPLSGTLRLGEPMTEQSHGADRGSK